MIKIETTTYFSNRLFRVGDRILVRNFTMNNSGTNNSRFQTFINREEGHTIINLDLETNGLEILIIEVLLKTYILVLQEH